MDILLFIPDLVLEVGEWSSSWETDRLNPRKSGALLGEMGYYRVTQDTGHLKIWPFIK